MEPKTVPVPWIDPDRLECLRNRLGVNWEGLADRVGVSSQTLYRMRRGESNGLPVIQGRVKKLMESVGLWGSDSIERVEVMRAEEV
jgi:predicted transcriptional regulator